MRKHSGLRKNEHRRPLVGEESQVAPETFTRTLLPQYIRAKHGLENFTACALSSLSFWDVCMTTLRVYLVSSPSYQLADTCLLSLQQLMDGLIAVHPILDPESLPQVQDA